MPKAMSDAARVLGGRIRAIRMKLGLSQEEIANLASMNVSNYGKLERGLSNPTFHTLVRVASVLNVDPSGLVEGLGAEQLPAKPISYSAEEFIRERQARRS